MHLQENVLQNVFYIFSFAQDPKESTLELRNVAPIQFAKGPHVATKNASCENFVGQVSV